MGDISDIPRPARRRRRPENRRDEATTLVVEMARQGPPWTCLGLLDPGDLAREVAAAMTQAHPLPDGRATVAIMLSTDRRVRALNKSWRGQDKPTNVLSFPNAAGGTASTVDRHLGDLILARETLEREAAELRIAPADHYRHLVLHGLLHLLGYDHETDTEAEVMEALETRILAALGVEDPYAGSEPVRVETIPSHGNAGSGHTP